MGEIVAMLASGDRLASGKLKKRVWQSRPPFEPAYLLHANDCGPEAPATETSGPMPFALFCAAMDAEVWNATGRKGPAPEFVMVVNDLCRGRVSSSLGFGGTIYLEVAEDAKTLTTLFSDDERHAIVGEFLHGLSNDGARTEE